jgi:hypothetical protein
LQSVARQVFVVLGRWRYLICRPIRARHRQVRSRSVNPFSRSSETRDPGQSLRELVGHLSNADGLMISLPSTISNGTVCTEQRTNQTIAVLTVKIPHRPELTIQKAIWCALLMCAFRLSSSPASFHTKAKASHCNLGRPDPFVDDKYPVAYQPGTDCHNDSK